MPRVVKRSASQAVKIRPIASRRSSPTVRPFPSFLSRSRSTFGAARVPRDQTRRIAYGRAHRQWPGSTAHPNWPRLDQQISERRRGAVQCEGENRLHRRRTLRCRRGRLPSFAQTQAATDGERGVHLVYYAFDLLHLGSWDVSKLRSSSARRFSSRWSASRAFNSMAMKGDGDLFSKHAGKLGFEGVVSKTIDAPYAPGNRGLWRKAKRSTAKSSSIVGWSDPEGSRPHLGALLLGYYTDDGKLIYAGRVGTGCLTRCSSI